MDILATAGGSIQTALERDPAFGGLAIPASHVGLDVWATPAGDEKWQGEVSRMALPATVTFHATQQSWGALLALKDRVAEDLKSYAESDLTWVGVGPDPRTNQVVIRAVFASDSTIAQIARTYGGDVRVEQGYEPITLTTSRLNDTANWNGGDATAMDNGEDCSSGPPIDISGVSYLLTAGHCYLSALTTGFTSSIYRTFNGSHLIGGTSVLMGSAAAEVQAVGYDDALIDARSSTLDWRTAGTADSGTAVAQKAEIASVVGASVCASGALSGERCSAVVDAVDFTANISASPNGLPAHQTVHTVSATNAGTDIVGPGDSGSPAYQVHADGLHVTGLIYAQSGTLQACTRNNAGYRLNHCSRTVLYENLSSILNHVGGTLRTS